MVSSFPDKGDAALFIFSEHMPDPSDIRMSLISRHSQAVVRPVHENVGVTLTESMAGGLFIRILFYFCTIFRAGCL